MSDGFSPGVAPTERTLGCTTEHQCDGRVHVEELLLLPPRKERLVVLVHSWRANEPWVSKGARHRGRARESEHEHREDGVETDIDKDDERDLSEKRAQLQLENGRGRGREKKRTVAPETALNEPE